jgi:peptidoglycan/LPS O-acetylase OafA/YrhL
MISSAKHSDKMNVSNTDDIPNLDFMRACAVLFVVGFHLLLFFQISVTSPLNFHSIGQWGVLIFFVHTSLVLALSLERQAKRAPGRRLFWPFLIRRVFRILPLSIFIVGVVELFRLPAGHLHNGLFVPVQLDLPGLFSNIFLVQNITHSESATAPLWSLPYEMQMYLLLPALFLLARSVRAAWPIVGLWVAGFIAACHAEGLARHGLPDFIVYVPCFIPGIIAYKLMATSKVRLPSILWPVTLAGITAFYLRSPSAPRGAIGCLLIGAAVPHFEQISQSIVVKIAQQIARYSYGIYLTHFICIWFAFQALAGWPKPAQWVVFVLAASVIPYGLYHVIEAPMIRYGRRLASRLG